MSLEGLDPDKLLNLAKQVNAQAQTLNGIINSMNGVAGSLPAYWRGHEATEWVQSWDSGFRPALTSAYDLLTGLHTKLVDNINQQNAASAADPGWTASGTSGGTGGVTGAVIFSGLLSAGGVIWTGAQQVEKVTSPIDTVASLVPGSDDVPVLGATGDFDTGMGMVTEGIDGAKAGDALANHQYAAAGGDLVDGTATALKAGGPDDPVLYLTGVTLVIGKEDYDLAGQIDWSQGLPNPLSGDNWSSIYAPALEAVPGEMVPILVEAFF